MRKNCLRVKPGPSHSGFGPGRWLQHPNLSLMLFDSWRVPYPNPVTSERASYTAQSFADQTDLRGMAVPAMTDFIDTTRAGRPCHEPDANLTELYTLCALRNLVGGFDD